MTYAVNRVAVVGSGTMGGALAAHFANAGIPVTLLDIVPGKLLPDEEKKGLTPQHPAVRNRIVNAGLEAVRKSRPAALFTQQTADLITVGNLEDDFALLKEADWILEAIVENLEIKRALMARLETIRKPQAIVTSNTSGIPIAAIAAESSLGLRRHFLGTHFFNPPRYMKLLEVIPSPDTLPEVTAFVREFCETSLGKGVVVCKDRPNFVANRVGSYAGLVRERYAMENGYTVAEVDALTGPLIGCPKTATFRLLDLVGADIPVKVIDNTYPLIPDDEAREEWQAPEFLREVVKRGWLGNKSGQGFYKQVAGASGKEYWTLDLNTLEYGPQVKPEYGSVSEAEGITDLGERLRFLVAQDDRAGRYLRETSLKILAYAANRLPEIADDVASVDNAMKWGFANELGPFETWDALGVAETAAKMEAAGLKVAPWVKEMLAAGRSAFYVDGAGYDLTAKAHKPAARSPRALLLKEMRVIAANDSASLRDLGDGVACLEFHTKMNALDEGIVEVARTALEEVDRSFLGLVVGNQGEHFSAGANVFSIAALAGNQEWERLDGIVKALQDFTMTLRYSPKPVVTAPFGYTFGGGCETAMAGQRMVAHAESYVGLVEVGMGLIPAGGGCKEMLRRVVSPALQTPNADPLPFVQRVFETIALAKTATSAEEARQFGFLGPCDRVVMNRDHLLGEAKAEVLAMAAHGFRPPARGKVVYAAGERVLAALRAALHGMLVGKYISQHDALVAGKLAYILCGGSLTAPAWVDEQYILDLEREAFLSLCGEEKTLERIWHFLSTGKPFRN